ncbi:MAG: exodeoxyribonuclease VII large subunit [Myxococcota bacterium]|nr:exodeoxyribonuclease VII large subunit [Myxococcota bacterium]
MATDDRPGERPASSRERPLGIAEVVRLAGRALDGLGLVWLEGEVTQVSQPSSGHLYFALQDRGSVLPAVMWGRDVGRIRFKIEAGQRLRVRGRLGVYDRDGKMQLYADFAEPVGAGAEAAALEQLKAKLAAEGMFAAHKKRVLPRFPRRIGVVTSANGAAIHDIIRTIQRRLPTPILIADAAVQGATAPHQIVMGMAMVVKAGVDVVIVGRGGGAATDLTAFNHERVVRTIARCPVPVISAVGHETDLSLADLAADARASTPTAAAELAVPDGFALGEIFEKERRRLDREIRHRLDRSRQDLDRAWVALHARGERALATTRGQLHQLQHRLSGLHPRARLLAHRNALGELEKRLATVHPGPRLARARREHDALIGRRDAAMLRVLQARRAELGRFGAQMAALSPLAVLDRGYAMVSMAGSIVRATDQVRAGDHLRVRLARGELGVIVDEIGDAGGNEP